MSLVTACMSCAFCTADEDDTDAWDADMDANDVDMFTRFSEAEGEGEGEGWGKGRGGQTPMRVVDSRCPSPCSSTRRHRTPTPH